MKKSKTPLKRWLKQGYGTIILIIVAGLAGYGLLLYSFTKDAANWGWLHLNPNQALNNYATAVAGVLGSAVTIMGLSFLIYAYWSQKAQSQFEAFNKLYENLLEDINSIQYRKKYKRVLQSPDDSQLFEGVDAIFHYECDESDTKSSVLNHLNLILISFKRISEMLEHKDTQIINSHLLLDKIYLLYLAKIYWPADRISTHYRQRIIDLNWGYPKTLFYHLDLMTDKAYRHLLEQGIIPLKPIKEKLDGKLSFAAELHKAIYASYGESDKDMLGPNIRSVLKCNYATVDTYWANPPQLIDSYSPASQLRNLVAFFYRDSDKIEVIMDKFDHGLAMRTRQSVARVRAFLRNSVQSLKSKKAKNPRGCL